LIKKILEMFGRNNIWMKMMKMIFSSVNWKMERAMIIYEKGMRVGIRCDVTKT